MRDVGCNGTKGGGGGRSHFFFFHSRLFKSSCQIPGCGDRSRDRTRRIAPLCDIPGRSRAETEDKDAIYRTNGEYEYIEG
jgi:hypothetical protein